MKDIDQILPEGIEKKWDNDLKQNYVEFQDGSNTRKMWIEDIQSLKEKLSLIKDNDLAGVSSWQKDMETDDVWQLIKEELGE